MANKKDEKMKAMVVEKPAPIESDPLHAIDAAIPEPGPGEILVRVRTCGVCRTDLHVAEGDLPPRHGRIIPGHEVVGVVDKRGVGAARFKQGDRVGIAWLRETCGVCVYCRRGRENLCPNACFTGYDHDGGYCEWAVVREDFAYAIPDSLGDEEAAPLLCAGIIGFRAIKRAEVRPGATVGLYGFGGSAHLAIQVLRHWGCRVFVMSRGGPHRDLAKDLGAEWIGNAEDPPPAPLDAAILFAPAGNLVLPALQALDRAAILFRRQMMTSRSRSCVRYGSRRSAILGCSNWWTCLRRLETRGRLWCGSWRLRSTRATSRMSPER